MQLIISFLSAVNNVQSRAETGNQVYTLRIPLIYFHYDQRKKGYIVGYGSCFVVSINGIIPFGVFLDVTVTNRRR